MKSIRAYHHNILKKIESSYTSKETVYTETDDLKALKDEVSQMEESLDKKVDKYKWNQG